MAIRIALGSQRSGILGLVFASAAKLAIAGCALGLAGAAAASACAAVVAVRGEFRLTPLVLALGRSPGADSGVGRCVTARAARSFHRSHEGSAVRLIFRVVLQPSVLWTLRFY